MTLHLALSAALTAHADPCNGLGVGHDTGSSVGVATIVRPIAGPALTLRLELRADETHLTASVPAESGLVPTAGEPAVFAFEDGTRASFVPVTADEARSVPPGTLLFLLDAAQVEQLARRPAIRVAVPFGPRGLSVTPEKDNQKALQDGARCVASRT